MLKKLSLPLIIIASLLILDQSVKIWIKTHMYLGQEFQITKWFIIHFTENNGMAFGLEFGGQWGKYFLSIFRIVAVGAIFWYLVHLAKTNAHKGLLVAISLIFVGALGNIIDSCFYGLIFNESYSDIASLFPSEGGYAGFLQGKVVDMLYFPLMEGQFPAWFPMWGGEDFLFFRPVFNIADSAITIGVCMIGIWQKKYFPEQTPIAENITENNAPSTNQES
jgi:signal peptidase II